MSGPVRVGAALVVGAIAACGFVLTAGGLFIGQILGVVLMIWLG